MRVRVVDEADAEIQRAAQWYEDRGSGLGQAFLEHVLAGFEQLRKHPRRYPRYEIPKQREIRRLLLDRFPYVIVYEMIDNRPFVLAVAHTARRPGYWRKRRVSPND